MPRTAPLDSFGAFQRALVFTLRWEGEFVNHPKDPGGATNWGITQRTFDTWRRAHGQPLKNVRALSEAERDCIYFHQYWRKGWCDALPFRLAQAHLDACVNHGLGRAARMLQDAINETTREDVAVDGIIGPETLRAVAASPDLVTALKYVTIRKGFYNVLARKNAERYSVFLAGWLNRADALAQKLSQMEPA